MHAAADGLPVIQRDAGLWKRFDVQAPQAVSAFLTEGLGGAFLSLASRRLSSHIPRILVYHRFGPRKSFTSAEAFARQLEHLRRHFNVVLMSQLFETTDGGEQTLRNRIAITVDDGHRDFYEIAYPLLRKYGIPCTFYVTTNFIGNRNWLWPDKLSWILAQRDRYPDLRIANETVQGGQVANASRIWNQTLRLLQRIDADDVEDNLGRLADQLGLDTPRQPARGYEACTWEQLREMEASGMVEVGGHTRNHPILSRLKPAKLADEIRGCLEDINAELGQRSRSFCYPNGQPTDFNSHVRDAVASSGFVSACTAFYDRDPLNDRFALRRYSAGGQWVQFRKAADGLEYWGARLLRRHNINGSG